MPDATFDVQALISSQTDTTGFTEAQRQLNGLAGSANRAKGPVAGLGGETAKVAKTYRSASTEVNTLSRVLLVNAGAMSGASDAARGISTAAQFAEGSAGLLSLTLAGLGGILVFLLPKIWEWINASKTATEEQKRLRDSMLGVHDQLTNFVRDVPNASAAIREWASALQALALAKQQERIDELTKSIEENKKQVAELTETKIFKATVDAQGNLMQRATKVATEAERVEAAGLTVEINQQTAERTALIEAMQRQLTLQQDLAKQTKEAREAEEAARKAAAENEKIDKETREGEAAVRQRNLDADGKAIADREAAEKKQLRQDIATRKAREDERRTIAEDRAMDAQILKEQQDAAKAKEALALDGVRAVSGAMGELFAKNKAVRIGMAIADTYAAANQALATPPGPPWSIPFMIAAIAAGLANVMQIRKSEVGFDNPLNDALAESFGHKFASDVVGFINSGFQQGLRGAAGVPGGITNNNSSQTFHLGGFFGTNKTQLLKQLNRGLIKANRLESRTRVS